jgi:SRSO17 transposase
MEKHLAGWKREVLRAHGLIAGLFARSELRARSLGYVQGWLSGCERKKGWQLAEWLGEATPYAVQHRLDRARWDAEEARDEILSYAIEELGSEEAVLIVDETGFVKKGRHSAGVQRQYSGTAGRIENSQVGVFLCSGSAKGAALGPRPVRSPSVGRGWRAPWCGQDPRVDRVCHPAGVGAANDRARTGCGRTLRLGGGR